MKNIPSKRLRLLATYLWRTIDHIVPELSTTNAEEIALSAHQLTSLFSEGCSIKWLLTGEFEEFNQTEKGRFLQKLLDFDREQNVRANLTNILYHHSICYLCDYTFLLEQASMPH
jgi:hypothetical protein